MEKFDALDALCAVSIKADRLDKMDERDFEDEASSIGLGLVATKASFLGKLLEMLQEADAVTAATNGGGDGMVRWGREGQFGPLVLTDSNALPVRPVCLCVTLCEKRFASSSNSLIASHE